MFGHGGVAGAARISSAIFWAKQGSIIRPSPSCAFALFSVAFWGNDADIPACGDRTEPQAIPLCVDYGIPAARSRRVFVRVQHRKSLNLQT